MTLEIAVSRGSAWLCMIFIRLSPGEIPSVETVLSGLIIVRHWRTSFANVRFGLQTEWSVWSRASMFEATAFHIAVDDARFFLHALDTEQNTWMWWAIRHVAARVIFEDEVGADASIVGNFTLRLKSWNTCCFLCLMIMWVVWKHDSSVGNAKCSSVFFFEYSERHVRNLQTPEQISSISRKSHISNLWEVLGESETETLLSVPDASGFDTTFLAPPHQNDRVLWVAPHAYINR